MTIMHHQNLSDRQVFRYIRQGRIAWAGNQRLKIFGRLGCSSGKRMHRKNRVFFDEVQAALDLGYRPCGHCMASAYKKWKNDNI